MVIGMSGSLRSRNVRPSVSGNINVEPVAAIPTSVYGRASVLDVHLADLVQRRQLLQPLSVSPDTAMLIDIGRLEDRQCSGVLVLERLDSRGRQGTSVFGRNGGRRGRRGDVAIKVPLDRAVHQWRSKVNRMDMNQDRSRNIVR
jgi:hypothetical protein